MCASEPLIPIVDNPTTSDSLAEEQTNDGASTSAASLIMLIDGASATTDDDVLYSLMHHYGFFPHRLLCIAIPEKLVQSLIEDSNVFIYHLNLFSKQTHNCWGRAFHIGRADFKCCVHTKHD